MSLRGVNTTSVIIDEWWEYQPPAKRIATFQLESKIFHQTHYYANPIMYSFAELEEMAEWCWETFGPRGYNTENMYMAWDHTSNPDYMFWFSEEKNLTLFILRWS